MDSTKQGIEELSKFMLSEVYSTLSDNIKGALVKRRNELCLELVVPQLKNLHRNKYKGCYAPHKPVMIITIMELISEGYIAGTLITASPELKEQYKNNWNRLVPKGCPFNCDWRNPFTYMDHEEFWTLSKEDKNKAYLSLEMFIAMNDLENRNIIRSLLSDMIFNDTISKEYSISHPNIYSMVAEDISPLVTILPIIGMWIA